MGIGDKAVWPLRNHEVATGGGAAFLKTLIKPGPSLMGRLRDSPQTWCSLYTLLHKFSDFVTPLFNELPSWDPRLTDFSGFIGLVQFTLVLPALGGSSHCLSLLQRPPGMALFSYFSQHHLSPQIPYPSVLGPPNISPSQLHAKSNSFRI